MIGIGTTLKQRFLLEKELGRGGMGAVYSATDQVLQRSVAIKLLKEQSGEAVGKRLRLEAQIAARLLHDNVVRIYDFDEAEGAYYLVMEQVDGVSYVRRWRELTLAERLRVLAQVADALDYAHHQGVIHRDIKPGNVLLTSTDVPKLSDFGLSLMADKADDAGAVRGTPHYMSPEQTKGKRLDFRTDLYSLGIMLYESAAGSVPFTGTPLSVMAQHQEAQPEPPQSRNPAISDSLNALILSLLAKMPASRPASGAAVAEALRVEIERMQAEEAAAAPDEELAQAIPAAPDLAALAKLEKSDAKVVTAPAPVQPRTLVKAPPRPAPAPTSAVDLISSALVRKMLRTVLAEPVILSADERYLMGHYLAYLLIWPRGQRIIRRRQSDRRNADRARYLLAMTYSLASGPTEEAVQEAAGLLDEQIEVRPALSPVVVAKFLSWRDTPQRRRLFRQTRKALQEASDYAQQEMIDAKGLLNPGLMPQALDDLHKIAPARTLVDDVLVERWNRLADAWRDDPEFRVAALQYATRQALRDPASQALWPEVVYPLIERARWQRRFRSWPETFWDAVVGRVLHMDDAGVKLDRLFTRAVPAQVVAQIDDSVNLMAKKPAADEDDEAEEAGDETEKLSISAVSLDIDELAADQARKGKGLVPLKDPDPVRFLQSELHELWKEAVTALQAQARTGTARIAGHRHIPIGPYRLVVVASIRGKAAGQIAIQGMGNKQIEMTTPSFRTTGSAGRPILAVWLYGDNSMVLSHLDFHGTPRYILWHSPLAHQTKFDVPADLLRELQALNLEPPDQLEEALSKKFRPRDRV